MRDFFQKHLKHLSDPKHLKAVLVYLFIITSKYDQIIKISIRCAGATPVPSQREIEGQSESETGRRGKQLLPVSKNSAYYF